MDDITILYISASAMPDIWMQYQIQMLRRAIGSTQIISVSRKPLDLGTNLIDAEPKSSFNIYRQMHRAALLATTPYVAQVEDDTLYPKEHFTEFRPPDDSVSYNRSRWSVFSWERHPIYCLRQRISNCSLIAPREYLIDALAERLSKWPNGAPEHLVGEVGRPDVDARMKVSTRKKVEWWSTTAVVQLNHPDGTDERQKTKWKSHGELKAIDIPYWGKAKDIVRQYCPS